MSRPIVIINGWSDNADGFKSLAQQLQQQLQRKPLIIDLSDYVSMDDQVTFEDLITAMSYAWHQAKLPTAPYSVDVVVHSTGGLIIRDWLTHYYTPSTVPIKHLVMLAPANFGSPLAHKGQSFIGRVVKGFNSPKPFEVGANLLKGLELASPYTWQLAMRDRFAKAIYYDVGKILCTVLIGNAGYTGISAAANEVGSDGTVRDACANLNCAYMHADFNEDPLQPTYSLRHSNGVTGFAVMEGENHATIANKDKGFKNPQTLPTIIKALNLEDHEFANWCAGLTAYTQQIMQKGAANTYTHGFQNTVSYVHNQYNQPVLDYFLEFYSDAPGHDSIDELFHGEIIQTTHAYADNTSYRSLYMDCTLLHQQLGKTWNNLDFSLTAQPQFAQNGNVGYRTFTDKDIGSIDLSESQIRKMFVENRTLLLEIILRREQATTLFKFQPFP